MQTPGWLNQNRYRNYPFVEDQTPTANGAPLPLDLCLDFMLVDHTHGRVAGPVELSNIDVAPGSVIFSFLVDGDNYTITIPTVAALPYEARVTVAGGGLSYAMTLVVGPGLATVAGWASGTYNVTGGRIEDALTHYQTRHRVVSLLGDAEGSTPVAGDVYFKEGAGVSIAVIPGQNLVKLNGYPGAGAGWPCDELPVSTLDIILEGLSQPVGTIEVDNVVYQFGDEPTSGSSSGGDEIDTTVYVPYGHTALETFENLEEALAANGAYLSKSMVTGPTGEHIIRLVRDEALVKNSKDNATGITMERYSPEVLNCNQAIQAINDVTPDGFGNMELRGGKGVEVESDKAAHTIYVRNKLDKDGAACGKCEKGAPNA